MKIYQTPAVEVFNIRVERGFGQSDTDMNYENGGNAWD